MALSKLGKFMLERTRRIGQAWAVLSYYTDQLMTPCSKCFSGESTLNGTPGGIGGSEFSVGRLAAVGSSSPSPRWLLWDWVYK